MVMMSSLHAIQCILLFLTFSGTMYQNDYNDIITCKYTDLFLRCLRESAIIRTRNCRSFIYRWEVSCFQLGIKVFMQVFVRILCIKNFNVYNHSLGIMTIWL